MSMIVATLGSVPASGFDWYVLFAEPTLSSEISEQIDKFFLAFGRAAGQKTLAVRGYDREEFRESVVEAGTDFYKFDIPQEEAVIIVTNAIPKNGIKFNEVDLASAKVMIFPLGKIYKKNKEISSFLNHLLSALKKSGPNAFDDLTEPKAVEMWSWLNQFVEMKPSFFGFKFDLGKSIETALKKLPRKSTWWRKIWAPA
jgi:hypothetical protein